MNLPDLSFKPKVKVIDERQIQHIHMATLEVLERTGVVFNDHRALELLDGAGARVDGDRVRIPAWLVEDSIRQAPQTNRSGQSRWHAFGCS